MEYIIIDDDEEQEEPLEQNQPIKWFKEETKKPKKRPTKSQKQKQTKKKRKMERGKEEELPEPVFTSKLTDCAHRWQEALAKCMTLLDSPQNSKMFDRYFELSSRLVNHPRCANSTTIYLPGGKKKYLVRQRVIISGKAEKYMTVAYGGMTERLRLVFHPDTSENPIEKGKRNRELGGREPMDKTRKKCHRKSPCPEVAAKHGTMVHNQLDRITIMLTQPGKFEQYAQKEELADPCVEDFVDECIKRCWFPLKSEFIVYDEDLKITTAVDMFLVDAMSWQLIAMELKTGYEGEEYGMHPNDVPFPKPLEELTNCPLNRHFLQLMGMVMILEKKYNIKVDIPCIVRLCPKLGVIETYEPLAWCTKKRFKEMIYSTLLSDIAINRR